ncbi:MAG: histidine--tRNA ligase [candidate division KSB1 bacterium]|nr:histidine--tRNA ligase [candidate division KSB1 bacterium]MDZ7369311.1 histidine--tRNA ligase [candidate division KSB1 bacterium]MDZ7407356.1 histidine--tRNA ligase [candidate division KSB1 bacterium]
MRYQKIKGTRDILPDEISRWQAAEAVIHEVMARFGFSEIRTPIFEETELFARGIGQLTDIVSKEMYTFTDRGDKSLTLRPELTAGVVRAFIENNLGKKQPVNKLYYLGPVFRQENPQAGRFRQFYQFGAEIIGAADPAADVETIALALAIYRAFQLDRFVVKLNSVGDAACREPYKQKLRDYLRPRFERLCKTCQQRFEKNPLRILDCKEAGCRAETVDAPKLFDELCEDCSRHFARVQQLLDAAGMQYELDFRLVRGLDYYTRTAYEIISDQLGAQDALCGGGRYDLLVKELGGEATPAVGFAAGVERLMIVLEKMGWQPALKKPPLIFLAPLGEAAVLWAVQTAPLLRQRGWSVDMDLLNRGLKAQLREANRQQARWAVIIGDNELRWQRVTVRDLNSSQQSEVAFADLISYLEKNSGS